jgi:nucleotide-binding universal stress UspA family protein
MTTILVGVDGSDRSLDAIAFTQRVAAAAGASVVVANVFPYDERPSRMANIDYRRALESDGLEIVRRMSGLLTDLDPERVRTSVIPRRSPAHGLHDLAAALEAELLVVGSSHVGAAGRVMPGSTGERLLHGATCPVAIVPKDYRNAPHDLGRIGVAYDATPEADAALLAAMAVTRAMDAQLRVIRVLDPTGFATSAMIGTTGYGFTTAAIEEEVRGEMEAAVLDLPPEVSAEGVVVTGDPAHELAAQSQTLDLLVIGSRGYGPLRAVVVGGVAGRLVRDAACPMVVVPRGVRSPLEPLFGINAEALA